MKNKSEYLLFILLLLAACGQQEPGGNNRPSIVKENKPTTVPGAEKLEFTDTIRLSANENMHYNKDLFRIKAGKTINLLFHNTGPVSNLSMDHNVVILNKDVDIADLPRSQARQKAKIILLHHWIL